MLEANETIQVTCYYANKFDKHKVFTIKKSSGDPNQAEVPCVVSLWKGADVYRKVAEAMAAFSSIYSISRGRTFKYIINNNLIYFTYISPSSLFPPVSTTSDSPANGEAPKVEGVPDTIEAENVQERSENANGADFIESENIIVQEHEAGGETTSENGPFHETQQPLEEQQADAPQAPTQTS
uniref:MSP domain-containing protein n=1 Tax=Heterorhabditis bacteriophora TaxID=37862 RepID=A0A1I7WIJ2_HETBA